MKPDRGDVFGIMVAGMATGLVIGILGSAFRAALAFADKWRSELILQSHATPLAGFLATALTVAVCTMIARWLVARFAPVAAGSGVQHVEAMMRGEAKPAGLIVLPVKFFGGLLAIGAGLPLGREGPTVQMGAIVGHALASRLVRDAKNRLTVAAAGAGAGLAVAFNAPLGGAIFVFEEVAKRFIERQVVAALAAGAIATAVMRYALGQAQLFDAGPTVDEPLIQLPACFLFGGAVGLLGAAYSWLTTAFLDAERWFVRVPAVVRAGAIGLAIGAFGWFRPEFIGGGDDLVQAFLSARYPAMSLLAVLAIRFLLGPLGYAAGVPGGLFAPLLVIGGLCGAFTSTVALPMLPDGVIPSSNALAVIGMAAMFTAVVRAPITGLALTMEMTGRSDCVLAMLTACLAATLFAGLVGSRPIYDVLRERMLGLTDAHRK